MSINIFEIEFQQRKIFYMLFKTIVKLVLNGDCCNNLFRIILNTFFGVLQLHLLECCFVSELKKSYEQKK